MIELGKIQKLIVMKEASFGVYLNSAERDIYDDDILLPKKQVPGGIKIGDDIEVFVYRDSEDRLIATTKMPKITLGEIEKLSVIDTAEIGAFLDWGLEKDLLLPFKEQTYPVKKGKQYLVCLYIDKSRRLCATMNLYNHLSNHPPYKKDDKIKGTIYSIEKNLGALVAVDDKYHGLIANKELYGDYHTGDMIEGHVRNVREDGKLDISIRKRTIEQMSDDSQIILKKLIANHGKLDLNDSSSPEKIDRELKMSKKAFKRAVGKLLKEGKIRVTEQGMEKN